GHSPWLLRRSRSTSRGQSPAPASSGGTAQAPSGKTATGADNQTPGWLGHQSPDGGPGCGHIWFPPAESPRLFPAVPNKRLRPVLESPDAAPESGVHLQSAPLSEKYAHSPSRSGPFQRVWQSPARSAPDVPPGATIGVTGQHQTG